MCPQPGSTVDATAVPTDLAEDEMRMHQALALARRAWEEDDEVPVGALLLHEGRILGQGWNHNIGHHDPTAHAEIVALRQACDTLGNHRLPPRTTLYVTLEPCAMCAMALVHARVARVVFAATDPKTGAAGSVFDTLISTRHNHCVAVVGGVLGSEAGELLRAFFRARR